MVKQENCKLIPASVWHTLTLLYDYRQHVDTRPCTHHHKAQTTPMQLVVTPCKRTVLRTLHVTSTQLLTTAIAYNGCTGADSPVHLEASSGVWGFIYNNNGQNTIENQRSGRFQDVLAIISGMESPICSVQSLLDAWLWGGGPLATPRDLGSRVVHVYSRPLWLLATTCNYSQPFGCREFLGESLVWFGHKTWKSVIYSTLKKKKKLQTQLGPLTFC